MRLQAANTEQTHNDKTSLIYDDLFVSIIYSLLNNSLFVFDQCFNSLKPWAHSVQQFQHEEVEPLEC